MGARGRMRRLLSVDIATGAMGGERTILVRRDLVLGGLQ